ncbi:MAG: DUF6504 family protein [Bacillota bacterium]
MSRIIDRPVSVETDQRGLPREFRYRSRHLIREILDQWPETGEWWDGAAERQVYRVLSDKGGVFELERAASGEWRLYKVYD